MKIHELQVDGFGVWTALRLAPLDDGLNVFYGPNEAGKSTLLQFVRTVLYGFAPERRRYLPPVHGGQPGGLLDVSGPHGRFQLARHESEDGDPRGELTLTAADGTRQGEHFLKVLLSEVDEAIFNHVFAISLHELQELATLTDSESAELLYKLTAGLDRVSLVEVLEALRTSRNQILSPDGQPCQLANLLAEREKLGAEIEQLEHAGRRYGRLAIERSQLDREIARLEDEADQARRRSRLLEVALSVRPRWLAHEELQAQLSALGAVAAIPADAIQRWDRWQQREAKLRAALQQLAARRRELRSAAAALTIHEDLWRQAARIEALAEQQSWIQGLQQQVQTLEQEVAATQAGILAHYERLGVPLPAGSAEPLNLSSKSLASLRPLARAAAHAKRQLAEAEQQAAAAEQAARNLSDEIGAALAAHGQRDLTQAMEASSAEVSRLRRRIQVDERLSGLNRYHHDLEQRSRDSLERQMMPTWVVLALGGVFMCGVVLLVLGLLLPTVVSGGVGWALALLGLFGTLAAALVKVVLDRSHTRQIEACQKQTELLRLQIAQAKEERDELDRQLPRGGGPLGTRLEKAESHLSALDALVPVQARRQAALQEAEVSTRRLEQSRQERAIARKRWKQALDATGLPHTLSARQIDQFARRAGQLRELQRRLTHRQEELEQRRRELAGVTERIVRMAEEAQLNVSDRDPLQLLQALSQGLAEQEVHRARRDALRRESRELRRDQRRHESRLASQTRRRRRWLRQLGLKNGRQLRQLEAERAQAEELRQKADGLLREIQAAMGEQFSQAEVAPLCKEESQRLETLYREQLQRTELLQRHLQERFQRRGQLAEQMKLAAEDRRLLAKRFELGVLEQRIQQAIHRWQVVAVTSRILDDIRNNYEQHRQPETLIEASAHLERLTQGHYRRVWTPLGEQTLRVDDHQGQSRPVEQLSRGTREQLFLALRLALTAAYARRGASLPLVLDDVLVNFDTQRAKAAAGVLRDFAAAGHQILVFTCHEHIFKIFTVMQVLACQLPDHSVGPSLPVTTTPSAAAKRRRDKPEEPPEAPVANESEDPGDDEDSVPIREPKSKKKSRTRRKNRKPPPLEPVEEVAEEPEEERTPDEREPWADDDQASEDDSDDVEEFSFENDGLVSSNAESEDQEIEEQDSALDEEADEGQWEEDPDEEDADEFGQSDEDGDEAAA